LSLTAQVNNDPIRHTQGISDVSGLAGAGGPDL